MRVGILQGGRCKTQECKDNAAEKSRKLNQQQDKELADAVRKAAKGDTRDLIFLHKIHNDDVNNREILISTIRKNYPELTYEQILQKADFYQKEAIKNPNWGWENALIRVQSAHPTEFLAAATNLSKDIYDFIKPSGAGGSTAILNAKKSNQAKGEKGTGLRGGSKKDRDKWYGYNDKEFQRWWHREGKTDFGGKDIDNSNEAKAAWEA
ncbi:hypothetical protein [Paralysiella testudinis]|uniref:Uncharacterized protein n=1 Tax=Paralysiella testudinis TaxID=2809020 RepID=A0A892ZD16_9NEIS|nr:hypothetical protein [Paralysiella testudinis]QRQ80931.1 hypothetical protein JQU52_09295 [Paralysiella testudinis]